MGPPPQGFLCQRALLRQKNVNIHQGQEESGHIGLFFPVLFLVAPWGKRSWKMLQTVLKGMVLYFFKVKWGPLQAHRGGTLSSISEPLPGQSHDRPDPKTLVGWDSETRPRGNWRGSRLT